MNSYQLKYWIVGVILWCTCNAVFAHESRPLFIQINEISSGVFNIKLNIPNSISENNIPQLVLPKILKENEMKRMLRNTAAGYKVKMEAAGDRDSIQGMEFEIHYPLFNPSITALIQIQLIDMELQTIIVSPGEDQFVIPREASRWTVMMQYARLGVEHIWAGLDHLLFVACLLFVAGFGRKLLVAITGFTIAHSITLFLAAMNIVNIHIAPVEACIALSIIFLCYEIAHHHHDKATVTYRYPVAVSSSFGLLHGLGFAAVLSDIGLPQSSKILGLLFFNIGVEIGQVIFIAALLGFYFLLTRLTKNHMSEGAKKGIFQVAIYSIGILSSYWFFDRIL